MALPLPAVRLLLAMPLGLLASGSLGETHWPMVALGGWVVYAAWLPRLPDWRACAWVASGFGLGLHGHASLWVLQSLLARHGASAWSAGLGWGTVLLYLVGLGVLAALWWQRQRQANGLCQALHFGALHGLLEWSRALPFQGEPIPGIGHAWVDTGLAGWIPWVGAHGLSSLLLAWAALAARAFAAAQPRTGRRAGLVCALFGTGLWLGAWLPETVQRHGPPLSYRLWSTPPGPLSASAGMGALEQFLALPAATLLVTPESTLGPAAQAIDAGTWQRWQAHMQAQHSHLLLGLPVASGQGLHNSLLMLGPQGMAVHHKHLLMPWGEYTPRGGAWLSDWLGLAPLDLQPGPWPQAPFLIHPRAGGPHSVAIGSLICQEEASSPALQRWLPAAHVLVNVANLQDFSVSGLGWQRLRLAQVRALEAGRPVLRAAHMAPSAHIDHRGRLLAMHTPGAPGSLHGWVQPMSGHTPYLRWLQGWLPWGGLALVGASVWSARRARATALRAGSAAAEGGRLSACVPRRI